MARSSGGGSRSGGSHSSSSHSRSSSSSSSSSHRISQHSFHGCRTFRYYRNGEAHYIYSDRDLTKIPDAKPRWLLGLFYLPFIFAIIMMVVGGFNAAKRPLDTLVYDRVSIVDELDVFTNTEEAELLSVVQNFSQTTGITTQIVTVPYSSWEILPV